MREYRLRDERLHMYARGRGGRARAGRMGRNGNCREEAIEFRMGLLEDGGGAESVDEEVVSTFVRAGGGEQMEKL